MTRPSRRLSEGGSLIDRSVQVGFRWNGEELTGFAGDTLASALLANGITLVGRSFKYHRPRGIWGAGAEEPNAIVDVEVGGRHDPNARATLVPLHAGLSAQAINAWPSLRLDFAGLLDAAHRFLPAGFYYKTFMFGGWRRYESAIRRMAGLGRVRDAADTDAYEARAAQCDVLVVGAGAAGLAAALAASSAGLEVILADSGVRPGGGLLWCDLAVAGESGADWAAATAAALAERGVRVMPSTTVVGSYDHGCFAMIERRRVDATGLAPDRLWQVRARQAVLATGANERPLVFSGNDRPGIMSAAAVVQYLRLYGVLLGRRVVVATNNDEAYETAIALAAAGAEVSVLDARVGSNEVVEAGRTRQFETQFDTVPRAVKWRGGVEGVLSSPLKIRTDMDKDRWLEADLLAVSGGLSPTLHLYSQAGGRLRYDERLAAFLPGAGPAHIRVAGAAAGHFEIDLAVESGHAAGMAAAAALGAAGTADVPLVAAQPARTPPAAVWRINGTDGRQWIDLQNDVTVGDVELAARESYRSVEHLKRYTTLGMATDQGKTSNVNGLAVLAEATGRGIADVGTTTFRPPFVPVSLGALSGLRRARLFSPLRRTPLFAAHQSLRGEMRDYGGWSRPAFYHGSEDGAEKAIQAEMRSVREAAGLFDASSLGKIEVAGPDAADFLDHVYYTTISTIRPGRMRYALLLREDGTILDDGVVARLDANRFLLSTSSGHKDAVLAALEEWQQTQWRRFRVAIHDVTAQWANITVSGPRSRELLAWLDGHLDLSDWVLPHMAFTETLIGGEPVRLARVSFTGERSYEIALAASRAAHLWRRLLDLGNGFGALPYGVEALMRLRTEKGHVVVGIDTDAATMPADIGFTRALSAKTADFVGKRSLMLPEATRANRRQLVGLATDSHHPLPVGAHVVAQGEGGRRSIGWVTSSHWSPTLHRSVALAMVEEGRARVARQETAALFSLGGHFKARFVAPCFYDSEGARLDG